MTSAEGALAPRRRSPFARTFVSRLAASPRTYIYLACALLAVITTYRLGKDMAWDTLDYHLYAGFSALHDRFGQDYFAAGPQTYFNPYSFVPFYLLTRSRLTALEVAWILAVLQSGILWLTYELAMVLAPASAERARLVFALCATALAFLNPVLINQFGSSFNDITTSEVVLLGWLVLVGAVRAPTARRIVCAGLLLGCASALKPTNAVHAVSAGVLLLFLPISWPGRLRQAVVFGIALGVGFVTVYAPWSIRLEEHFGNPVFPLLNGLFRSPQFPTAHMISYRFVPTSLSEGLLRPFALIIPRSLVQVEEAAPDLRYALLLTLAVAAFLVWGWKRFSKDNSPSTPSQSASADRLLAALGSGFLLDWVLWLAASGNGRYFIPMACLAGVLSIALTYRLFSRRPRMGGYLLVAVFGVQILQLHAGTEYHLSAPWGNEPWFAVSVPHSLAAQPALYFNIGVQSNSFIAPYVAPGAGFVNLEGDYTLGPMGENGAHIAALIKRFSPHLRMLVRDNRVAARSYDDAPDVQNVNDALEPFGLRVATGDCARIAVRGMNAPLISVFNGPHPPRKLTSERNVGIFVTCGVVASGPRGDTASLPGEVTANLALDHLEDACPALFQPARMVTYFRGDARSGYDWTRRYGNTDMGARVSHGRLLIQSLLGGSATDAGPEGEWASGPPRVLCTRRVGGGYFLKVE